MKKILLIYFCLICNIAMSQNIMKVEQHSFKSKIYNATRSFRVALPASTYQNVKYNLLFVLDADYTFDVIASTAIYLQTFDYIPPTAVVAVDYSSPGNRNDVGYNISDNSLDANGKLFYDYVNTELADEISRTIPTSGFNTLIGHSYTASYLNYYISQNNDYVRSYILFSPEEMPQIPDFKTQNQAVPTIIRIITSSDDTESRQSFGNDLYETFKEKQYDARLRNIKADHMSVIPTGIAQALTDLYDKYYNTDSIYEIIEHANTPIWECFTHVNNHNQSYYKQALPVSGSCISAFLWTAIQKDEKESIGKLRNYYEDALKDKESDPNALGVMGDLLGKLGLWEEADYYLQRCLDGYKQSGQDHETLYWRKVYALNVLPRLGQCEKAWTILEDGKKIYTADKAIFSYYQGVLSITNKFRIKDGVEQLRTAIKHPDTLINNFVKTEEAEELLNKGMAMEISENRH